MPGDDFLLDVYYINCESAQQCYNNYDLNYNYLLGYINNMLILMTVDLSILTAKTYYAVQVILKGQYQPLEERKYYSQYFILAIIYYFQSLLKYILI